MVAEEISKTAGAPSSPNNTQSGVGNGDMAHLIGSLGSLIDSTLVSVQGAITSVNSATGQLVEGVTSTIKSEPVQVVINTVSSATEQLIKGVNATINPESIQGVLNSVSSATGQLIEGVTSTINSGIGQSSFQELGKLWTSLLENLNAAGSSNQVQNLFNNVSAGLGQLMNSSFIPGMPGIMGGRENKPKKDVTEILFTPKKISTASEAAVNAEPVKTSPQPTAAKHILVTPKKNTI